MMKRLTNLLIFIATVSFFTSCVAEKKGKSPSCGVGEEFNKVSQKCINVRRAPTSTLETIEIYEDSAPSIFTLKYTDENNDQAIDCRVYDTVTQIELRSPIIGSIRTDALAVVTQAQVCANSINAITYAADSATAMARLSLVESAYRAVLSTDDSISIYSALSLFNSQSKLLGDHCESLVGQPISQFQGSLLNNLNDELSTKKDWVNKRCYCSAGTCTSEIYPLENQNGDFGITYNITEGQDGTSINKEVSVSVLPVNDNPVARDFHVTGLESVSTSSLPVSFSIPVGYDVESDLLSYEIVTAPSKGFLSGCSIANDGSLPTQINCFYIPNDNNDGVASPLIDKKASVTVLGSNGLDGVMFQSLVGGTSGESITVVYKEHPLLNSGNNVDVKVSGRNIEIYIEGNTTTVKAVVDAINNDPISSSIVLALSTNVATENSNTIELSVAPESLTGSNTPFDTFTYRVRDIGGTSVEVGYVSIDIELQDDNPVAVLLTDRTFTEDQEKVITISMTDAEGDLATSCNVNPTDSTYTGLPASSNLIEKTACSCTGATQSCTVTLKPKPNYYGNVYFTWDITNDQGVTTSLQYVQGSVTAVNDAPLARYTSSTHLESPTALVGATPFVFQFQSAVDLDDVSFTYNLVSGGTVTGCVSGTVITPGIDCNFFPADGNVNGEATTLASDTIVHGAGNITFTAKSYGHADGDVQVNINRVAGAVNYTEYLTITGNSIINVFVEDGVSTLNDVKTLIDSHIAASELVSISVGANVAITSDLSASLTGGETPSYNLQYTVTDSSGATSTGSHYINITPVDDIPVICPYSTYPTVKDCGLAGCTGTDSPINRSITPTASGIVYYDSSKAICYRSNASNGWDVVTDYSDIIPDQIVHQNGSIKIDNIVIDEGGADTAEDTNTIKITNVEVLDSGNNLVPIKVNNIKFYQDNTPVSMTVTPTVPTPTISTTTYLSDPDGSTSLDTKKISMEIIPTATKVGEATIKVHFVENDGTSDINPFSTSFKLTIADVAIQHNGWKNIVASGPKVDHFGDVKDEATVCSYNDTKCNGGAECKGDVNTSYADEVNAIFLNSSDNTCYLSTASGVGTTTWIPFNTYCGATQSYFDSRCSVGTSASCAGTTGSAPAASNALLNSLYIDYLYNAPSLQTTCYRAVGETTWEEYKAFGKVLLKWNAMTLSGSGSIVGYNIYRRLANQDFDYKSPINRTLVTAASTQYEDNSSDSFLGPIPNTVYYYEVVPVVVESGKSDQFQVRTSDINSRAIIRVLVPGENKSLVPRDIVNITVCEKINDSASTGKVYNYDNDLNTYTCAYEGPGSFLDTSKTPNVQVYDYGQDLIVDRFEAGCAYTKSTESISSCSADPGEIATDGSCIGVVDPNGEVTVGAASEGQIYYNRVNGKCFESNAGSTTVWTEVDSLGSFTNLVTNYAKTQLPPLTSITQANAANFCAAANSGSILGLCDTSNSGTGAPAGAVGSYFLNTDTNICYFNNVGTWVERGRSISSTLPTRKQQVAYSEWDYDSVSDSIVNSREGGLSLNSNSKCNTNSANGLESFYTDDVSPIANSLFTLPGTSSSSIRSVMTGSEQTNLCVSKYNLQDTVGNVSEWSSARMSCTSFTCTGLHSAHASSLNANDDFESTTVNDFYKLDGIVGPCIDLNADGTCDDYLTSWLYDQKSNSASRFFIPLGLPAVTNYPINNPTDVVSDFFEQIGISSGITSNQLHDDSFVVNQSEVDPAGPLSENTGGIGAVLGGGSFKHGNGAGTYHFELMPTVTSGVTVIKRDDIGFRCVSPVPSTNAYIE